MSVIETEQQFLKIYETYADAIYRHCYYRVSDKDRAKDFTQETFTRTWNYILKGTEIKNAKAFLYRVANNLIIDASRKKKEASLDELQLNGFDPSSGFEERDKIHQVLDGKNAKSMLRKLDSKYRKVIVMRYIDDLSPREIAEILGETVTTISVRVHRGLKKLREVLENDQKPRFLR